MDIYDYYFGLCKPKQALFREVITAELGISYALTVSKIKRRSFTIAETFYIQYLIETKRASWAG